MFYPATTAILAADHGDQFPYIHWLHQIDVGPLFQACDLVFHPVPGGQHDDGHVVKLVQAIRYREAAFAGQAYVQYQYVAAVLLQVLIQAASVGKANDLHARIAQQKNQLFAEIRVVLNQHDTNRRGSVPHASSRTLVTGSQIVKRVPCPGWLST